jgi:hypothetical protein
MWRNQGLPAQLRAAVRRSSAAKRFFVFDYPITKLPIYSMLGPPRSSQCLKDLALPIPSDPDWKPLQFRPPRLVFGSDLRLFALISGKVVFPDLGDGLLAPRLTSIRIPKHLHDSSQRIPSWVTFTDCWLLNCCFSLHLTQSPSAKQLILSLRKLKTRPARDSHGDLGHSFVPSCGSPCNHCL